MILAICLGTAALTEAVGLSLALGAFAAGLIVSASDYAHRALDQMLPLRDAFVALFFVTVGMLINPRARDLERPGCCWRFSRWWSWASSWSGRAW